jgi:hypothetical protein
LKFSICAWEPGAFFCGTDFFWLFCILYIQIKKGGRKMKKKNISKNLKKLDEKISEKIFRRKMEWHIWKRM